MSFAMIVTNAVRTWRARTETRTALERLRSERLLADIGYTPELAEAETGRWFFQPLLNGVELDTDFERFGGHTPIREQRSAEGLMPLLFPARA